MVLDILGCFGRIKKMYHYFLFPSLVSLIKCENFSDIQSDLISWIYNYQQKDEGRVLSNMGGWQSSKNPLEERSFDRYKSYIKDHINEICNDTLNAEVILDNLWININKKNDFNWNHIHPQSHLSGVFWVKCPKNSGTLVFDSPNNFSDHRIYQAMKKNYSTKFYMHEVSNFQPEEGSLILFPPNLRHGVTPNLSNEDRISIAFNLQLNLIESE